MDIANTIYTVIGVAIIVIGFGYAIWDEYIKN